MKEKSLSPKAMLSLLDAGEYDSLPREMTISLDDMDSGDFLALLEIARIKSFGQSYVTQLERVLGPLPEGLVGELPLARALVDTGNYREAIARGNELSPRADADLAMQQTRAKVFLGHYREAATEIRQLMARPDLRFASRGDCHQLLGHCLLEMGEISAAKESLRIASQIAEVSGNRLGRLNASLFLVKSFCLTGDLGAAQSHFVEALSSLSRSDENFRWLIGLFRTWAFLLFSQDDPRWLGKASAAVALAGAVGDQFYRVKTIVECMFMAKTYGPWNMEWSAILRKQAARSKVENEGDLPIWLDALQAGTAAPDTPTSLRHLLAVTASRLADTRLPASLEAEMTRLMDPDASRVSWILDRDLSFLIDLDQKTHRSFQDESPILRMIETLSRSPGPQEIGDVFTSAWGVRWNKDRHVNTVAAALNRLNAKRPSYLITRKASKLSITHPTRGLCV